MLCLADFLRAIGLLHCKISWAQYLELCDVDIVKKRVIYRVKNYKVARYLVYIIILDDSLSCFVIS